MILWTLQPIEVYDIIQRDGVFRADKDKISMPEFLKAYDWMKEHLDKKDPCPGGCDYPIWAWYRFDGKHKKPDLRYSCYGPPKEKYVCITLDIPDEKILLSDFELWHCPLNNSWIHLTEQSSLEFELKMVQMTKEERKIFRESDEYISQMRDSWEVIFDIPEIVYEDNWIRRGHDVQAIFWELKKEYIKKVQFFTTR